MEEIARTVSKSGHLSTWIKFDESFWIKANQYGLDGLHCFTFFNFLNMNIIY